MQERRKLEEATHQKECCMCGDVGFAKDLLLCHGCGFRFQHRYCSRLYPNLDLNSWACEWCLCAPQKKFKASKLAENENGAFEFLVQIAQSIRQESIQGHEVADGLVNTSCKIQNVMDCGKIKNQINPILEEDKRAIKCSYSAEEAVRLRSNCKQEVGLMCSQMIPKKERCNQANDKKRATSIYRWKHHTANKFYCKPIRRRYKLLADVLCVVDK
eukprot:Gb_33534 [translate_table: standard]